MHGGGASSRPPSRRCSSEEEKGSPGPGSFADASSLSDGDELSLSSIALTPHSPVRDPYAGTPSLGGSSAYARSSSLGGSSRCSYEAAAAADAAAANLKARFVEVLEARGWGQ